MGSRNTFISVVGAFALLGLFCLVQAGCATQPQPGQSAGPTAGPAETATPEVAGVARAASTQTPISPPSPTVGQPSTPAPSSAAGQPRAEPNPTAATATPSTLPGSYPFAEMDSYTVRTGDSFGLHGGGFQPGEQVRVYLSTDPGASLGETQADSQGVFALSGLRLPGRDGGDRTITVEGQSSGLRVERTVATVAYSPWVRLNQYAVKPGESVGFSGYDFAPGEQVQLLLDGNQDRPLAEAKANDRGEISNQSVLTTKPADVGTHRLTFAGQTTHSSLDVQFEVLGYTPEMELSSYAGRPGAEVAFEGKGFAPGEAIRAYMHQGQKKTQVATFQADAQGVFSQAGEFRVPENAVAGPLPLTVEGDESKSSVGQTFTVDPVAPWVGLSSYSGPAGTKLTAQTKGFGADETVNVYLNDSPQPVASGQTDLQGATESGTFSIPEDAGPSVTVVLRGQGSGAEGRATFSVNR